MKLKSVRDLKLSGKRVLLRVVLNTPLKDGRVSSDFRIRAILPTIDYLVKQNCKVIILSKVKRPFAEDAVWKESHSLKPFVEHLGKLLNRKVLEIDGSQTKLPDYDIPHLFFFKQDFEKHDITPALADLRAGDIAVLENIRFYKGEMQNDPEFAKKVASFGDFYINDAFGDSHSGTANHASIVALPKLLPSAAGLSMIDEVEALSKVMEHPKKPVVLLMGGMKLSTKSDVLKNLAKKVDKILLGGGIANLLLKASGFQIGKSMVEEGQEALAKQLLRDFKNKIRLPVDVIVSTEADGPAECVKADKVKSYHMILDIGPETIKAYSDEIREGKTLIWNGPMGRYEEPQFSHGTFALARFFASRTKSAVFGVVGGGETLDAVTRDGLLDYIDHVSTGGGTLLDFLAGKPLPGIEALKK